MRDASMLWRVDARGADDAETRRDVRRTPRCFSLECSTDIRRMASMTIRHSAGRDALCKAARLPHLTTRIVSVGESIY